jgi:hypothetical protein
MEMKLPKRFVTKLILLAAQLRILAGLIAGKDFKLYGESESRRVG